MTYVVQLARTRYAGTNHTHLTELLMEREGIDLSRSTVRRILVSAGMDSPPPPPAAVDFPDTVSGANAWPKKGCCCR